MKQLEQVSRRRNDALTRMGWDRLETLLAIYYRGQGYRVERAGTGERGERFDGIDLKLRRDDEYIVVQCKHWSAMELTHNAVHELLGIMVNESATGAMLVTRGGFTQAAIEAAGRQGHVQLIDGDKLRAMIGPASGISMRTATGRRPAGFRSIAMKMGERLLSAAGYRVRGMRRGRDEARPLDGSLPWLPLVKIGSILVLFSLTVAMIHTGLSPLLKAAPKPQVARQQPLPLSLTTSSQGYVAVSTALGPRKVLATEAERPSTQEQIREARRRAAEAMRTLEDSGPEM